jgi:hypothetical protein
MMVAETSNFIAYHKQVILCTVALSQLYAYIDVQLTANGRRVRPLQEACCRSLAQRSVCCHHHKTHRVLQRYKRWYVYLPPDIKRVGSNDAPSFNPFKLGGYYIYRLA